MMVFGLLPKRKTISYEQQKAKIAKWLYSHKKGGLSFRMKDIMRYSDEKIREKDRSLLKHTTRKPPVYVDADTAFKIISDLHSKELLTVGLSANKVEEFEVQFDGRDAEWQGIRVFNPNDLLMEPIRFIRDKIVWFLLTLFSSLISVYSRNILEWLGLA